MKLFRKDSWKALEDLAARLSVLHKKIPQVIQLTRLDRPVGIYLLLWPTIASLWVASDGFPPISLLIIFILGTIVMRSAGCCINDFADYRIDGEVSRTKDRPLVLDRLDRQDALICFGILSSIGFCFLLFTNMETILLSFVAVSYTHLTLPTSDLV